MPTIYSIKGAQVSRVAVNNVLLDSVNVVDNVTSFCRALHDSFQLPNQGVCMIKTLFGEFVHFCLSVLELLLPPLQRAWQPTELVSGNWLYQFVQFCSKLYSSGKEHVHFHRDFANKPAATHVLEPYYCSWG